MLSKASKYVLNMGSILRRTCGKLLESLGLVWLDLRFIWEDMYRYHVQHPNFDGTKRASSPLNMARLSRHALKIITAAALQQSLYFVVLLFLLEGLRDADRP